MRLAALLLAFPSALWGQTQTRQDLWVGHRLGSDRLLILMVSGQAASAPPGPEPGTDLADSVGAIGAPREIPAAAFRAVASTVPPPRAGDRYTILLGDGQSAEAVVEALVAVDTCSDVWMGARARITRGLDAYRASPAKQFLVSTKPVQVEAAQVTTTALSTAQRAAIERDLTRRMLAELPRVERESATSVDQKPKWRARGEKLRAGKARFEIEASGFRFAREDRWFVRARWTVDEAPAFLLWAIVRPGTLPVVEQVDVTASRWLRTSEWGDTDTLSYELIDHVVGVFAFGGETWLLLFEPGLESYAYTLYRYAGGRIEPAGVQYATGC
jgi:hypothetical protein